MTDYQIDAYWNLTNIPHIAKNLARSHKALTGQDIGQATAELIVAGYKAIYGDTHTVMPTRTHLPISKSNGTPPHASTGGDRGMDDVGNPDRGGRRR